jgi:probable H4MPT-linked C1 transfer pathway protein
VSLPVLGLDIGGANLKAAHSDGVAFSQPFPLWKQPDELTKELEKLGARLPAAAHVAATMTGELCDCFASKADGVRHILRATRRAFPEKPIWLWRTDARLVAIDEVGEDYLPLAAANWSALACFVGRLVPRGPALLIDMGSTTTDIIPLFDGHPMPKGRTDRERLRSGEMVYVGASRTPLCALLGPGGRRESLYAAEWFATTLDAYLLLGVTAEDPHDSNTADGRPATLAFARARIARMLCADADDLTEKEILDIAAEADLAIAKAIFRSIEKVFRTMPRRAKTAFICGSGENVLRRFVRADPTNFHVESFQDNFGPALSACACAYALAVLTKEDLVSEQPART